MLETSTEGNMKIIFRKCFGAKQLLEKRVNNGQNQQYFYRVKCWTVWF